MFWNGEARQALNHCNARIQINKRPLEENWECVCVRVWRVICPDLTEPWCYQYSCRITFKHQPLPLSYKVHMIGHILLSGSTRSYDLRTLVVTGHLWAGIVLWYCEKRIIVIAVSVDWFKFCEKEETIFSFTQKLVLTLGEVFHFQS